jgi:hypothetical protein
MRLFIGWTRSMLCVLATLFLASAAQAQSPPPVQYAIDTYHVAWSLTCSQNPSPAREAFDVEVPSVTPDTDVFFSAPLPLPDRYQVLQTVALNACAGQGKATVDFQVRNVTAQSFIVVGTEENVPRLFQITGQTGKSLFLPLSGGATLEVVVSLVHRQPFATAAATVDAYRADEAREEATRPAFPPIQMSGSR